MRPPENIDHFPPLSKALSDAKTRPTLAVGERGE